jgi:glucuronokinase
MELIETRAYARAALAGNPSDGYFGKTLSLCLQDFSAHVVLYEWPTLEILPGREDHARFASIEELAEDVRRNGYYGGLRLVKAAIKKFYEYCVMHGIELHSRNFSIRYETDVPRQVGLAGSSAIITATFRALMQWYRVLIPREILPNWVRATEQEELGITGGLQDRVAQSYSGLVYMDFERAKLERDGFGTYVPLDPQLLPPLYLAYAVEFAEESGVVHNDLRARWERGDHEVVETMAELADLAEQARACMEAEKPHQLGAIIDANFELRRRIVPINAAHGRMVNVARGCGASAHFAGSGGTIIGTYEDVTMFSHLKIELGAIGCCVLQPKIAPANG